MSWEWYQAFSQFSSCGLKLFKANSGYIIHETFSFKMSLPAMFFLEIGSA